MKTSNIKKMALSLALVKLLSCGTLAKTVSADSNIGNSQPIYHKIDPKTKTVIAITDPSELLNDGTTSKIEYSNIGKDKNERKFLPPANKYISESEVIYADSNIYANYEDKENPYYKRYDKTTNEYHDISIFDIENCKTHQYGANQNAFKYEYDFLIGEPLIWEEIQKYYPINEFESEEEAQAFYKKYFELITICGCGHAAATDRVFRMFEGRESEFEKIFGYPMYTVDEYGNIDFNYELFMLKFFNYSSFIGKPDFINKDTLKLAMLKDYYEDEFNKYAASEEYNMILLQDTSQFLPQYYVKWNEFVEYRNQKWNRLYNRWQNAKQYNITLGIYLNQQFGNIKEYLKSYGLDIDVDFYANSDIYNVDDITASENFSLYKVGTSGEMYLVREVNGPHYYYVTDDNDDNRIIVSSWGDRYILDDTNTNWTSKLVLKK